MAYNTHYSGMNPLHSFNSTIPPPQIYSQEEMDFWMQNDRMQQNIDPSLRAHQLQSGWPSQEQGQQPLQRWAAEPEKMLFTTTSLGNMQTSHYSRHQNFQDPSFGTTASFPKTVRGKNMDIGQRMDSPTPSSSHEPSSTCSSALSPPAEAQEYYTPSETYYSPNQHIQDDYSFAHLNLHQGLPDPQLPSQVHGYLQQNGYPYNHGVNLSQVQGFADPDLQDSSGFEAQTDEGYIEELKNDYHTMDDIHQHFKGAGPHHTHYHATTDEGLGASIKDEASPQNQLEMDQDMEASSDDEEDAEADIDEHDIVVAQYPDPDPQDDDDLDSDTEYKPAARNSTRASTRRSSRRTSTKNPRTQPSSNRIPKSTHPSNNKSTSASGSRSTGGRLTCKQCPSLPPFASLAALQTHSAKVHTRPFTCIFSFAGCTSTFASKNEWKRHVSSQHLALIYWCCTLGTCAKSNNGTGAEFNRKDLFTQHLRRMHAPFAVKRKGEKSSTVAKEWEESVRSLQTVCERVRREAPERLGCCVGGCDGAEFLGKTAWDERMEHVGKHLDKGVLVDNGRDRLLLEWALRQGVVEAGVGGRWSLCGGGSGGSVAAPGVRGGAEEDAEGEDE